jgi:hypothetical protein
MWNDPIVDEVRKAREDHAAKFNYDIDAIIQDLREKQNNSLRSLVTYKDGKYVDAELLDHISKEMVESSS